MPTFDIVPIVVPMRWSARIADPDALRVLHHEGDAVSLRRLWHRVLRSARLSNQDQLRRIGSGATRISFILPMGCTSGEIRDLLIRGKIRRDKAGLVFDGVLCDLTQDMASRKLAMQDVEDRAALAVRELNHRVRNIMSVVTALITLSSRFADDVDAFSSATLARIQALNVAYSTTGIDPMRPHRLRSVVDMRELAGGVLLPFRTDGEQIQLSHEPLSLSPGQASALGLVLHELASNAAAHGALSAPEGRVDVSWAGRGAQFEIVWSETGVPVQVDSFEDGFGMTIVKLFARNYLNGSATWRVGPDHLEVTIAGLEN